MFVLFISTEIKECVRTRSELDDNLSEWKKGRLRTLHKLRTAEKLISKRNDSQFKERIFNDLIEDFQLRQKMTTLTNVKLQAIKSRYEENQIRRSLQFAKESSLLKIDPMKKKLLKTIFKTRPI